MKSIYLGNIKAQTALEFVMVTGAIFLFFVSFIGLLYTSTENKNYEKKDIALNIEARYLADEIALAHEAGNGYERTFTLPNTILGDSYKIEIIGKNSIYAYSNDKRHALSINTLEVNYLDPSSLGYFEVLKTGKITNIDGVVWIE